jgi:hypothetical protein
MQHPCHCQVIYRASVAAGPLASWVKANLAYSAVLISIAPLQKQLNDVMAGLQASQQRVDECARDLVALDQQVGPGGGATWHEMASMHVQPLRGAAATWPSPAVGSQILLLTH